MITIKLPYTTSKVNLEAIKNFQKQQSNAVRYLFNRIQDAPEPLNQKALTQLVNSMNHVENIDSWFKQSAVYKATSISNAQKTKTTDILKHNEENPSRKKRLPKIIFGGRKAHELRSQHKIKRSEIKEERTLPLCSIGEALQSGNRKFRLQVMEQNRILFKPDKDTKIFLQLPKLRKNYSKQLSNVQMLMESKKLPVQFELDQKHIYISFEPPVKEGYKPVLNRYMAIDLNPNYIGYSILDWSSDETYKVVKTGMISIKDLNDNNLEIKGKSSNDKESLYWNSKREHEIFEISKELVTTAQTFNVEVFGIEGLDIKSQDNCRGKKFNRLVNNFWCRDKLTKNIVKRLKITGILPLDLPCAYSSFVGNLLHKDFPDPIAASLELNRRIFAIVHKDKKSTIFPFFKACKGALTQSLEEISQRLPKLLQDSKDWKDLYSRLKNSKMRYRVPLDRFRFKVFRLSDRKSFVDCLEGFSII